MNCLIVGADRLGSIPQALRKKGAGEIYHWSGREELRRAIPSDVEMIIILHDYINHNLAARVKREAKERGLPVVYSRRSIGELGRKVERLVGVGR
ncbi:MAG: hypothetical protein A2139_14180 [Desulfobacca sp. RBG_16_60_12]|nr:MAG: hypothetical protein A2139_14180 [Desulfobacca sp. RBG_16_60_12]